MKIAIFLILLTSALSYSASASQNESSTWLLVETGDHVIKVMEGSSAIEIFEGIAIGRRGVGLLKERNDNKTPIGKYRIGWINDHSKYHRFFGFTFPNRVNAELGYKTGLIGEDTYEAIRMADLTEQVPPQNTPLGGQIGIHGIGRGNLEVHRNFDWTRGCIALTNEQIDRLSTWVKKGTLVVIR